MGADTMNWSIPPFLVSCLVLAIATCPAGAVAQSPPTPTNVILTPDVLFQQVSASVFVVEVVGNDGRVVSQGSGVVVAPEGVATNRHVVEHAGTIRLRQGSRTWAAVVRYIDPAHDLVQLGVSGVTVPPLTTRPSTTLKVGERVYAVGAPQGLELTLSEGLVSSLRSYEDVQIIQTSAPISPGSSGGGLFDAQGRLVGITTFFMKEGQNLNFALPSEWIGALPSHPAPVAQPQTQDGKLAQDDPFQWYLVGVKATEANDLALALSAFQEAVRLKPDYVAGWVALGFTYDLRRQFREAIEAYEKAMSLKQDDADTWMGLGLVYSRLGRGAETLRYYREAVRLKPSKAGYWSLLGAEYREQRQPGEAIIALREALRLDPDSVLAYYDWYNLGRAYGAQRQYGEAITAFREALRNKPDYAEAWYALGVAHALRRDRQEVREIYEQLKTLDARMADEFFRKFLLP
jgi:tetratricopeptide (TPR) repeat protein